MANNKKAKKVWADLKNGKMSVNELNNVLLESASLMKELVAVIEEEIASDKECFAKSVDGLKKAMESLENIANCSAASEKVREVAAAQIYDIAMKLAELEKGRQKNSSIKFCCLTVAVMSVLLLIFKMMELFISQKGREHAMA